MKKLMFLGGGRFIVPAILAAKEQGYHTITCDYLPNNFAHKFSDEYHNISIIDKEDVLHLAENLKIDGIMSFAVDPGVTVAAYVADKMDLPNVGPYESVCILQNKGLFRKFLKDNGFRTPDFDSFSSYEEAVSEVDRFIYPVMIKPVDGSGSKGVTKANNINEALKAIKNAQDKSFCNEFIIEEYIEKKGNSSDSDSFSLDGKMVVTSFNSQYFDDDAVNPYVPSGYTWPSSMSEESQKILKGELQRLISLLGMKTALYNIETREDNNNVPYIMECSPRAGGNRLAEMIRIATGVDMIKSSVRGAVGDEVKEIIQKPYDGNWCELILHAKQSGLFKKLWLSDDVKPYVVECDLWVRKNDKIEAFSSASQAVGTLVLNLDDIEKMSFIMNNPNKHVKVIV